jgi:hypothetical protein
MSPLDDEHRASIEASLPPGVQMTPKAWAVLAETIAGYRSFETRRTTHQIKAERARWKRIGDAVDVLASELRQLRRETPWDGADPGWINRSLAALWELNQKVETRAAFHAIWSTPFRGTRNPHRDFLYAGVMRVWADHLGGEVRCSRPPLGGAPGGPLVRFFTACVAPVLGDKTPRSSGIAEIIDRERAARNRHQGGEA